MQKRHYEENPLYEETIYLKEKKIKMSALNTIELNSELNSELNPEIDLFVFKAEPIKKFTSPSNDPQIHEDNDNDNDNEIDILCTFVNNISIEQPNNEEKVFNFNKKIKKTNIKKIKKNTAKKKNDHYPKKQKKEQKNLFNKKPKANNSNNINFYIDRNENAFTRDEDKLSLFAAKQDRAFNMVSSKISELSSDLDIF